MLYFINKDSFGLKTSKDNYSSFEIFKPKLSLLNFGCIPFDQSKFRFCDPKFDFSFH